MASLRVIRRKDTDTLQIVGSVGGMRIRRAAGTANKKLAKEAATALEADILRTSWHGERKGSRTFGEAVISYARAQERRTPELKRLERLTKAVGENTLLRTIDQDTVSRMPKRQP